MSIEFFGNSIAQQSGSFFKMTIDSNKNININWLLKYMKDLGYQYISNGVCLGLSYMAMQAMLLGDMNVFINRLKLIKKNYHKHIKLSKFTKNDTLAFLDGVELYQIFQCSLEYSNIFNVRVTRRINWQEIFNIISPISFQENQINIYNIYSHAGCYKVRELKVLLGVLEQTILKLKDRYGINSKFNNKIPILLISNTHAIMIGYDYINNNWGIVDPGYLSLWSDWFKVIGCSYNKEQIAGFICIAFTGLYHVYDDELINIGIEIYIADYNKKNINVIKNYFSELLYYDSSWQLIHLVIASKIGSTIVGESWLYTAAFRGHYQTVKHLIRLKANINLLSANTNITPLFIALQNNYVNVVRLLIEAKAKIDYLNSYGCAPIGIAAYNGYVDIVNLLIKARANINSVFGFSQITPLLLAAQNGHDHVVALLIKHKAHVNTSDNTGVTPLHMASQSGYNNIVDLLVRSKADVNVTDVRSILPIHVACNNGHGNIVNLLIQAKANIYQTTSHGFTPLYLAYKKGHMDIMNLLLQQPKQTLVDLVANKMSRLNIR